MSKEIKDLIERASKINMSRDDREAQRRSFAYGNAHIENDRVTREMIDEAARELTKE